MPLGHPANAVDGKGRMKIHMFKSKHVHGCIFCMYSKHFS